MYLYNININIAYIINSLRTGTLSHILCVEESLANGAFKNVVNQWMLWNN